MPKFSQNQRDNPQTELPISGLIDQKAAIRNIRNYLAGQVIGLTRDESLLEEVLKCAFCRVHLEREGNAFSVGTQADAETVARQYRQTFKGVYKKFSGLFESDGEILLGPRDIFYIDRELAPLNVSEPTRDLIGDIYEAFMGLGYRGQEGQFFTPKNAVKALVELTCPTQDDIAIDPACGAGSFLLEAAKYIASSGTLSPDHIHGVDKDSYLVRLSKLHLALQFDTLFPVHCADSLLWGANGFESSSTRDMLGKFTLVLTNPPFGSKIVALTGDARTTFELAYKWSYSKHDDRYYRKSEFANNTSPQILFVERCISLLTKGGRLGIVLPESILSNPSHKYVVQYILDHTTPLAVIGMPESLFKTSGKGGTHTKVCLVVLEKKSAPPTHKIFMAEAKWCGHDSRGREIPKDDIPTIIENFRKFKTGSRIPSSSLGFLVQLKDVRDFILAPRFYDPEPVEAMSTLKNTHDFFKVSDLVKDRFLSVSTGDELGKLAYGTGDVPFVRTSDISNWEIKVDPKHTVSEEVYRQYAEKQDVREGDILIVRDGTYLIGTCAFVSKYDTKIVYQSHLFKIRVCNGAPFDNYLLLAILSSPPVISQIKAMSFTQDIINSLGDRIYDLILPVPKSLKKRREISAMVKQSIEARIEARELARRARQAVVAQ